MIDPDAVNEVYMEIPLCSRFILVPIFELSHQDYLDLIAMECEVNPDPLHIDTEILVLDLSRDADTGDFTLSNGYAMGRDPDDVEEPERVGDEMSPELLSKKSKRTLKNRYEWRSIREMTINPHHRPLYYMDHTGFRPEDYTKPIVFINATPIYVKDPDSDSPQYTTLVYALRQEDCLCLPAEIETVQ